MKFYNSIEEIRADREVIREKIRASVASEGFGETIVEAMEHYVGSLMAVINPMKKGEVPFLIAALRLILTDLERPKGACAVAKVIDCIISTTQETIEIDTEGRPEE